MKSRKIRYQQRFTGEYRTVTVSEYIEKELLGRAGSGVHGQVENLAAQLEETQTVLLRLVKLFEADMSEEDIQQLCDPHSATNMEVIYDDAG